MRFLKEKKGIIISFIIGVILASSITVYAYSYIASDVKYTKKGKDGTESEISVQQALNELYSSKKEIQPLEIKFGPFMMGTESGYTNNDFAYINELSNYSKLIIQCTGNMGTYISARVYVDNNLIMTISDLSEHIIELNNNDEMKINFYSYNSLVRGVAGVTVRVE